MATQTFRVAQTMTYALTVEKALCDTTGPGAIFMEHNWVF